MAPLSQRMFEFLLLPCDPDDPSTYHDAGFTRADEDEAVDRGFVMVIPCHDGVILPNTAMGDLAVRVHRAFLGVVA